MDVKLTFKEGGHHDFQTKFELLKERLQHARELELETGQSLNVTDEQLPAYDASGPTNAPAPPRAAEGSSVAATAAAGSSRPDQPPLPGPDEPPPDYVEAQSQAIGMQYEERMREEAERQ